MSNINILFHDDSDGYASALAAYQLHGDEATYIPVQYKQPFPNIELNDRTIIYILDFSYSKEILLNVKSQVGVIRVIDHHATAQEQLKDLDFAIFDMNKSGARLSWEFFQSTKPVPNLIQLVEDRDLWRFTLEHTKSLEAGINASGKSKHLFFWNELLHDDILLKDVIEVGSVLVDQEQKFIESFVRTKKFKVAKFDDFNVAVYNTSYLISETAAGVYNSDQVSVDFVMSYFITTSGSVVFSLRSSKKSNVNVGAIAAQFGGGGHNNASGFSMELPEGMAFLNQFYSQ